ncbi:hypothetical protein [Teredinibacter waterburyi]|uniref:hypothetical protein n=1 Tax=Teredinibacter waterburyi TaxID=1500538 RepID=UPI00165F03A7|nr:hypothetical protein [Teredinibacter waterburyi]
MLQASRLKPTEGTPISIAGNAGGKRILCSNQALPVYNELVNLANSGNHWAGLVVRGIKGLTSGRLHMDNVYVQQETSVAYGRGVFYLVLPGVTATLEDCADGTVQLRGLNADANYMKMQENKQRPGLWRIAKGVDEFPEFQSDGAILKKDYRPVVISDQAKDDPKDIAKAARNDLVALNTTIKSMVSHSGFDLHHTPGRGGIVGLKPATMALATAGDRAKTESATLLANSMYKARNIEGVLWFADWGGSAILTRALQILNHQGTTLEKHSIFLNRPTSNSSQALALAKEMKLTLAGNGGKNTGLRKSEIKGNHMVADISGRGAINTTAFGLTATGAAFGLAGVGATVGGAVSLMGALYFVTTTVMKGRKQFSGKKYK